METDRWRGGRDGEQEGREIEGYHVPTLKSDMRSAHLPPRPYLHNANEITLYYRLGVNVALPRFYFNLQSRSSKLIFILGIRAIGPSVCTPTPPRRKG